MKKRPLAVRLGLIIRQFRLEIGLSQEDFADLCQLHRTYIGSIERGEKNITVETACKLANALGIKLSEVFFILEQQDQAAYD